MKVQKKEGVEKVRVTHNKKLLYAILVLFVILICLIVFILVLKNKQELERMNNSSSNQNFTEDIVEINESLICEIDADCVPASCCHSDSCINKNYVPNCEDIACSLECRPGTLDCGGKCSCSDNKCSATFYNEETPTYS